MATTTTEDAFREIQLNGKQLFFLFMAVVVVSVVIFLCGVLVGRGVRAERAAIEALAPPPAAASSTSADAVVPAVPPSATPNTANEDLSYPSRLAGNERAPEKLRAPDSVSAAAPAARTQPPAPAKTTTPAPAPAPVAATKAAAASSTAEPSGGGFAIQVAALRQRAEADSVARGLASKGYPAYVMNPDAGAPAVFRVRVGRFKDRREAESIAAKLQKEEQFKPWIVR
jgi:cell division septation protein DedD